MVGSRNRTKLVDGVLRQVRLVSEVLAADDPWAQIPVRGMLCFIDADWPLLGGGSPPARFEALWPKRAVAQLQEPGQLSHDDILSIHQLIATAFPAA